MTPTQRKALHRALDHAINTGSEASMMLHPNYEEDELALLQILSEGGHTLTDGRAGTTRWVHTERDRVTVFSSKRGKRAEAPAGTNLDGVPANRRFDVV